MTEQMFTRRSYDAVATQYAAAIGDELRHKPLDRALLNLISDLAADGVVLDLGCGPGHVAAHLAEHSSVIGLDLSEAMAVEAWRTFKVPVCVGDLTALPIRTRAAAAVVCLYAVIHLDDRDREAAYAELARVLQRGGHALIAFHVRDADHDAGDVITVGEWWGNSVELKFRFLEPKREIAALACAGLELVARVDRVPYRNAEHPSERCYLLVRSRTD
jgi:SAM-dependent methyltransferase